MTEDQFQAACWQWVWNTYPQTRRVFWAVPNGGDRDIKTAAKLKATGVLSGVHDLHLLWDGQFYTFELKVGSNQLTTDTILPGGAIRFGQKEWGDAIVRQGGVCFEVRPTYGGGGVPDLLHEFKGIFNAIMLGIHKIAK